MNWGVGLLRQCYLLKIQQFLDELRDGRSVIHQLVDYCMVVLPDDRHGIRRFSLHHIIEKRLEIPSDSRINNRCSYGGG